MSIKMITDVFIFFQQPCICIHALTHQGRRQGSDRGDKTPPQLRFSAVFHIMHALQSTQNDFVSDIAIFVLKRDVKLQLTN